MEGKVLGRVISISSVEEECTSERVGVRQKNVEEIVSKTAKELFQGLVVVFDLEGKIFYANDRVRFLTGIEEKSPTEGVFFDYLPWRERDNVIQMFCQVYRERRSVKKINCSVPLLVGPYEVNHEKVKGELMTFSEGLILKIPDKVLAGIKEMELEKLKLLLLKHPHTGLWVTDEKGVIVDIVKGNCELNLGWSEAEVLQKNISFFIAGDRPLGPLQESYFLNRVQKNGSPRKTEVVEGEITLSNGGTYHIYLDTYF